MFRIMKMYSPNAGGHTLEIVLGIIGAFFLLLSIICLCVSRISDWFGLFFPLCLAAWYVPFGIFLFIKWPEGYLLERDRIIFHCKCKRNQLLYADTKCIIITNLVLSMTVTKTPWVALIGEQEQEIISYIMDGTKRHVLTSDDIKYKLGEKIGYWHPGNIETIFKKGSSTTYNYGFWWNKKEMYHVLEGFGGDYYIAASVLHNYKDEFHAICEKYGIEKHRIHIVDDTVGGEFIWRY